MTLHPEFVFINASIANEPLNILLIAAGLWGCVRLILSGPTTRLAIFLGVAAGLIVLAKMTGLVLILLIVIAMLIAALRGHSAVGLWRLGIIVAALLLAIGSWWYIRNIFLYGDPWQRGMYDAFYKATQRPIAFSDWLNGLKNGEVSFWATFGWFNILVPEWMYTFYKLLVRLAGVGLILYVIRWLYYRHREKTAPLLPRSPAPLLLLLASPLGSSLILIRLMATEEGIQGRQLLPILPALALLIVIGYRQLIPGRWLYAAAAAAGTFMAALTLSIPIFFIAPAYAFPPLLAEADLPADMVPLERIYGDQIGLLGYKLSSTEAFPGEPASITLYWQALKPIEKDYTLFIHGLGRRGEKVGEYNGYPGRGNFPVSQWPVDKIIEDRLEFVIDQAAKTPTLLRLHLGFFDFARQDLPTLTTADAQGNEVSSLVVQQPLLPGSKTPLLVYECISLKVEFADNISLNCYDIDDGDKLRLHWSAESPPTRDYTVFIQLWQDGRQVAGFDGPPVEGDFPTSYWRQGLQVVDIHPLDLSQVPPANYHLLVGLYDPQTGERLPSFKDGQPLPDHAVDLGELITISPP
jgi:hypothetical protein